MNQPLFVDANLKRQPARSNAAIPRRRPSVSKGRRMKSSSHERSSTGCQSFPPRPPSTALTLRQESLNTLRRRGRKIISTNLTATWSTKCQGCPDPFPSRAVGNHHQRAKLQSNVRANLFALSDSLLWGCQGRSADGFTCAQQEKSKSRQHRWQPHCVLPGKARTVDSGPLIVNAREIRSRTV